MFVMVLKRLAEYCEFDDVLNDRLRDRLVCGLHSKGIQKRLLTESSLTLQRAFDLSTSMEFAQIEKCMKLRLKYQMTTKDYSGLEIHRHMLMQRYGVLQL